MKLKINLKRFEKTLDKRVYFSVLLVIRGRRVDQKNPREEMIKMRKPSGIVGINEFSGGMETIPSGIVGINEYFNKMVEIITEGQLK